MYIKKKQKNTRFKLLLVQSGTQVTAAVMSHSEGRQRGWSTCRVGHREQTPARRLVTAEAIRADFPVSIVSSPLSENTSSPTSPP